jgi:DNA polymerase III subunit delta'
MPGTFDDIFGQDAAVEFLRRALRADRLPHALIFAGPAGVGKGTTARALGKLFLCEKPKADRPCGQCDSCRVFDADNHPDFHLVYRQLIRLEKESSKAKLLPVDVVRDFVVAPANRKPSMGRGKVFVVEEAELMNAMAQNALLKTLEEPYGRALIVLLTDQPGALLPTIRSRSQVVRFGALDEQVVVRELVKRGMDKRLAARAAALSGGALGVALRWVEDDVIEPAEQLVGQIDALFEGHRPDDLPGWFKRAAEAYAEKQLQRDELGSKDQATREGLALYLRLAAEHVRRKLAETPGDPDRLERACRVIDALARAETYLAANVNIPLTFQQLTAELERKAG